jgi:NADH:ubiquinone oxidoreductase subunit D
MMIIESTPLCIAEVVLVNESNESMEILYIVPLNPDGFLGAMPDFGYIHRALSKTINEHHFTVMIRSWSKISYSETLVLND